MKYNKSNIPVENLKKITIPVHVLAGEKDVIKLDHTKLIADNIENSTLEIIKNENHGSYIVHSNIACFRLQPRNYFPTSLRQEVRT